MLKLPFLFCLQAWILQIAYTQCVGSGYPNALSGLPPAPYGPGPAPYGPLPLEGPLGPLPGSYGGAGVGGINVVGEMPVAGSTVVAGEVPILGAVRFLGEIPAAGIVSLSAACSCGLGPNAPFAY